MQPVIDPSQPLPVYVQLKTLLLEGIIGGRYAAGERLPTEHELCALYGISRTPVHRALAELAEEGAILRHRRRGTFVNPHWLTQHGSGDELRVVVPEGPWEDLVREACPVGTTLSVAPVALEDLHQVLVHAVAEGRAPDVALLDSVWVREFASAGFLLPLDEVDPGWMGEDYLGDLLQPFRAANEYDGRPVAVQAEADVVGLWYHRGTLDDAGIAPPRTWAELARAGAALRARGVEHPLAMPAGSRGGEATSYCLLGLLATNGVEVLREGRVTIDSPGTTECLTLLRRLTTSGTLSVDAVTYERERALRLLAHGQAAFAIGGSYELSHLAAETGVAVTRVWDEFGFVAPPAGPRGGATTLGEDARRTLDVAGSTFTCAGPFGDQWAYEADGLGGRRLYHDANDVPTALAPLWGLCEADDPHWRATMRFAFSEHNPGYVPGAMGGLGSAHTPGVWPLGDAQEWAVAVAEDDGARVDAVVSRITQVASEDGMLPETYDARTGDWLARHWFAWPGSLVGLLHATFADRRGPWVPPAPS